MRGKHGQRAETRHAIESRDAEIATYQRAVARLTAERNEAREKLRTEEQRNRKVERELRARLDQAASPKIQALELKLAAVAEERDSWRQKAEEYMRRNRRIAQRRITASEDAGISKAEALHGLMVGDDDIKVGPLSNEEISSSRRQLNHELRGKVGNRNFRP